MVAIDSVLSVWFKLLISVCSLTDESATMLEAVRLFKALYADRRGVTVVEYGIMASLIAGILVTAVGTLNGGLTQAFGEIARHLTSGT